MRAWLGLLCLFVLLLAGCGQAQDADRPAGDGETAADGGGEDAGDGEDAGGGEDGGEVAGDGACTFDEPVKVGVVFSQTGGAAVYGATQRAGVELAADELNARGPVTYELVIEDDASDPAQGITAFEKLVNQDGVAVIIGPTLSNTAFSTDPIAQEAGVPVLGVSNTATGITDMGDFVFRDSLMEAQVIPQTVAAAREAFGLERVAVLYGDDDSFTVSGWEVFVAALADEGIETTTTQTFAKGDTDFSPQLTAAREGDPDALVVSALAEEGALILSQARDLGLDIPVIGGNGFNSPAIIEQAGEAAEGVVVGAAWNSAADDPPNQEFKADYEAATGSQPDQFAAQSYTGMYLIDAAVTAACSTDGGALRDALAQIRDLGTVLGSFSFTDNRDADHPAVVQVIRDGSFAILD